MVVLIMTEGMVFAILLASYFFLRAAANEWPLEGIEAPELTLALPFSFVLWGSSIPIFWAEASIRKGRIGRFKAGMAISFVMGLSFLLFTLYDFEELTFGWRDNAYGSIYYTIVGLHALHVFVGLAMSVGRPGQGLAGPLRPRPPRQRRGVLPVLALRRRGLAARVPGPLPVGPRL